MSEHVRESAATAACKNFPFSSQPRCIRTSSSAHTLMSAAAHTSAKHTTHASLGFDFDIDITHALKQ